MIALVLLRKYWTFAVIVALVGIVMAACHQRDNALRAEGAAKIQLAQLSAKLHTDSIQVFVRDSAARVDTVRLTRIAQRFDTVRKTLRVTDTIAVREFITVADSTVRACRQAVLSLALSCAAKDTVIRDLRNILAIKQQPAGASKSQRVLWGIAGLATGIIADRAIKH